MENMEQAGVADNPYRLELGPRNEVQKLILHRELGPNVSDEEMSWWLIEQGRPISDILDQPEYEHIRALARAGKYEEAADAVIHVMAEKGIFTQAAA